ncbi:hypothetical protein ACSBR1_033076 [Camellia fascicularis]
MNLVKNERSNTANRDRRWASERRTTNENLGFEGSKISEPNTALTATGAKMNPEPKVKYGERQAIGNRRTTDERRQVTKILVSMQKIVLPPLQSYPFLSCILSSPPTDPNRVLIFVCRKKPSAMFCRLGDGEWTEQHLRSTEYFRYATVCEGKIYGLTLDRSLLMVDVVGSNLVVTQLGAESPPRPSVRGTSRSDYNLVDSCGELFLVIKSYLGMTMKIRDVEVHKMDFSRLVWTKVDSLGDGTFFLSIMGNCFSCSAAESGIKHNSIYYLESSDRELYVFDLENYSISFSTPCPLQSNWLQPEWIMPIL